MTPPPPRVDSLTLYVTLFDISGDQRSAVLIVRSDKCALSAALDARLTDCPQ